MTGFANGATVCASFVLALLLCGQPATAAERPNVIIIYADDQSIGDVGAYGADDIHTPHIDALARRGVRLTQMYAPSPVCSPSRAGLLTGRMPHRAGLPSNASAPPLVGIDDGHGGGGLASDQPTMGRIFREAGYATAAIGKWHMGYQPGHRPDDHGFDHWFGHLGGCIDNYSHFFYWNGPNRHDLWRNGERVYEPGRYFPDLMLEEARQFIESHADQPFLMYYALNTPHYPYQGEPHWIARYQEEGVAYPRDLFGAFVSSQDERVGALMATLEAQGLRENTIVIYQADHGHSREERAHFGGGDAGPYRGAKFSVFEGGIRVPAIISWPAGLPEGEVRGQMAHGTDWLPTLAAFCDIDLAAHDIDGRTIAAVLRSEAAESPHDVLHWQLHDQWAVRRGPWKLIANARDPQRMDTLDGADRVLFLANLDDDPGERTNLADAHPEIVEELRDLHARWVRRR